MRDASGENTKAFQLLRVLHLSFEPFTLFLSPFALRNVDDRAQNPCAFVHLDGIEPDLHGKLTAVLAQPVKILAGSHGPRLKMCEKVRPVPRMRIAKLARH